MAVMTVSPAEYLKRPYSRIVIPDEDSGTYTAQIAEFPGCIAQGDSLQEAYDNLGKAAVSWIEAALDMRQEIPSPSIELEYGGRVALRLPKNLHRQASAAACKDGVSVNQFIVAAVAEKVGASTMYDTFAKKLEMRMTALQSTVSDNIVQGLLVQTIGASNKATEFTAIDIRHSVMARRS